MAHSRPWRRGRPGTTALALLAVLALVAGGAACGGSDCEDDAVVGVAVLNDLAEPVNLLVDETTGGPVTVTLQPGERERFRVDVANGVDLEATVCTLMGASCVDSGATRSAALLSLDGCTDSALVRLSTLPEDAP